MNQINANTILKNLTAILCALIIVALILPFASFSATASSSFVSAEAESESLSGFTFVMGGGILGILFGLMPVLILAACYLPQLSAYKKYISLGASVLGIVLQFIVPGQYSSSSSSDYGAGSVSVDVSATYKLGFWVILVLFIIQAAVAVIQFFNLKGNKVFDAINAGNEGGGEAAGASAPHIDTEKITGFAKNVTDTIKGAAANVSAAMSQGSQSGSSSPSGDQAPAGQADPNAAAAQAAKEPAQSSESAPEQQKASADEIMELLGKLHKMKEAGILTEEEFNAKKADLLSKM